MCATAHSLMMRIRSRSSQTHLHMQVTGGIILAAALLCVGLMPGCGEAPSTAAMLREADLAFESGSFGRAAHLYYQLRRRYPDVPSLRISLGSTYLKLGWLPYAGGEFSEALRLSNWTNAFAWLGLGTYYARTSDWKLAALCFSHARTSAPADPLVYRKLGNAFVNAREYSNAAENYLHAATLGDRSDELYTVVGMCYERTADWPRAVGAFEQALTLNSKNIVAIHHLATLYRDRFSNVPKARQYHEMLMELSPELARAEADALEQRARDALVSNPIPAQTAASNGPPDNATNTPTTAAKVPTKEEIVAAQKRTQADYYQDLAHISLSNDLPKQALRYFERALEADSARGHYNYDIAHLYEETFDDLSQALRYYERFLEACKDDPRFEPTLLHVEDLRARYRRQDEERRRRVAEEEDRKRAEAERRQREEEQRRAAFAEAQQSPETYDSVIEAGAGHLRTKDLDEARRYFQKAVTLNPRYPNAYYNLGLVCVLQTNHDAGVEYFSTALTKDPSFAEAHLALGTVYAQQQKTADAIEHFTIYLELAPNTSFAASVRDWLTKNAGAR
jgi:tetratricopeptide (TPR) repeat protein